MSVLLDTGIVYAYYDRSDGWHHRARTLVQGEQGGLILPAPAIPEVDHLLGHAIQPAADQAVHRLVQALPIGRLSGKLLAQLPKHRRFLRGFELKLPHGTERRRRLLPEQRSGVPLAQAHQNPQVAPGGFDRRLQVPMCEPAHLLIERIPQPVDMTKLGQHGQTTQDPEVSGQRLPVAAGAGRG